MNEKIQIAILLSILTTSSFLIGRASVKPKTKTEVKTEKLYGLPEGTDLAGICGNFLNIQIEEEKKKAREEAKREVEYEKIKFNSWQEGYKEGYREERYQ